MSKTKLKRLVGLKRGKLGAIPKAPPPAQSRASKAISESKKKTAEARAKKEKKRKEKASVKKPKPSEEDLAAAMDEPPKAPTANDVERWFNDALIKTNGPDFITPRWTGKEYKLAKVLLQDYGPDLVGKAVIYICEKWDDIVQKSRGRLMGKPSIDLLWAMRSQIFGEVQDTRKRRRSKDSDEFNEDTKTPNVGW